MTTEYGTRIPPGFNGSQPETLDALFQMAAATIQTQELYYGWTIELKRSPIGEWRFVIKAEDKP